MADKALCPWCGAEMRMEVYNDCVFTGGRILGAAWRAFYRCHLCRAQGPEETRSAGNKAEEAARAAALRRYTPILKPMTLEEVIAFDGEIWMEDKSDFDVWACRCFFNRAEKKMTVHYIAMNTEVLEFSTYGKTWRCWERKPTEAERSAAEWET